MASEPATPATPFEVVGSGPAASRPLTSRILNVTVLVCALGYFVDIYDLLLFSIVRVPSLRGIGVPEDRLLADGVLLLNAQMTGLLLGGILWGVLGDKRGRRSVLFGSIALYSVANIANAFVTDVTTYAVLRFVAGVGLAGELGAAVTLVSEVMTKETRAYGTAIVAAVGILGAVVAALIGNMFQWQVAYLVGGGLGLLLLLARATLTESDMFRQTAATAGSRRGDLRLLLASPKRAMRFLNCVLVGLPIWFGIGILVTFSPEISRELGVSGVVVAGTSVAFAYAGASVGDLASGVISQIVRSRIHTLIGFIAFTAAAMFAILFSRGLSPAGFYVLMMVLGFGAGYWAVFVTNAAEQFGTNLRATVATTTPNLVRGSVVPMTLAFTALAPSLGLVRSALVLGVATILIALWAARSLQETWGRDLDFVET